MLRPCFLKQIFPAKAWCPFFPTTKLSNGTFVGSYDYRICILTMSQLMETFFICVFMWGNFVLLLTAAKVISSFIYLMNKKWKLEELQATITVTFDELFHQECEVRSVYFSPVYTYTVVLYYYHIN